MEMATLTVSGHSLVATPLSVLLAVGLNTYGLPSKGTSYLTTPTAIAPYHVQVYQQGVGLRQRTKGRLGYLHSGIPACRLWVQELGELQPTPQQASSGEAVVLRGGSGGQTNRPRQGVYRIKLCSAVPTILCTFVLSWARDGCHHA